MADDNILDVPKSDVASDPSYDNDPVGQADLTEDIKRKQLGRQIARLVSTYTNNNNSDDTELLSKLVNAISNIFRGKSD